MKLVICETQTDAGKHVAEMIAEAIKAKPDLILGLPTGSTPVGVYSQLVKMYNEKNVDFSGVKTFNLDEYLGLDRNHECSYNKFMFDNLFSHVNVKKENVHIPNGVPLSPEDECAQYEKLIEDEGGLDLLLIGIGNNGHVGFNEPGTDFNQSTHIAELAQSTIDTNARFFEKADDVPRKAITMGIKTILSAKKIVLLALGQVKSQIVFDAFNKEISTNLPASALQTHQDVVVVLDKTAGALF